MISNFSKKLSVAIFAIVVLVLDAQGYLKLDPNHVKAIQWVLVAYIGGQSVVDAMTYPPKKGGDPKEKLSDPYLDLPLQPKEVDEFE